MYRRVAKFTIHRLDEESMCALGWLCGRGRGRHLYAPPAETSSRLVPAGAGRRSSTSLAGWGWSTSAGDGGVLVNPFSGVKVKGTERAALDASHAFTEGEWQLLRTIADGLEWSYGWKPAAAQRLRFVLDFGKSS